MKLEQLIKVAEKGAVLKHISLPEGVILVDNKFQMLGGTILFITDKLLDNNWKIVIPHPGACTECRGLGSRFNPKYVPRARQICPHCKGTGNEPKPSRFEYIRMSCDEKMEICGNNECGPRRLIISGLDGCLCRADNCYKVNFSVTPERDEASKPLMVACPPCNPMDHPKPEVITVRVTGCACSPEACWYATEIDKVFLVTSQGKYYRKVGDYTGLIVKTDVEVIPNYDHSKFRLMARDEQKQMGDMFSDSGKWIKINVGSCGKQHSCYIYLRPIPEEPQDGCLVGYHKVEVRQRAYDEEVRYYSTSGSQGAPLYYILSNPRWSGRYGYIGISGQIHWLYRPRIYKNREGIISPDVNSSIHVEQGEHNIPVIPDYVEMQSTPEEA